MADGSGASAATAGSTTTFSRTPSALKEGVSSVASLKEIIAESVDEVKSTVYVAKVVPVAAAAV